MGWGGVGLWGTSSQASQTARVARTHVARFQMSRIVLEFTPYRPATCPRHAHAPTRHAAPPSGGPAAQGILTAVKRVVLTAVKRAGPRPKDQRRRWPLGT